MKSKIKYLAAPFFASNQQLIDNMAKIAFGQPMGSEVNLFPAAGSLIQANARTVPGIFCYDTALSVGDTLQGFDAPINKAARFLFAKYWQKNTSVAKFQEMDIAIYTLCAAQNIALIGYLERIYGAMTLHTTLNKYVRSALLRAMGVDPVDFSKHYADLRGYINLKITDMMSVNLDGSLPIFGFAHDMYQYVLKDSPNDMKTQLYISRPNQVLKYVKSGENIGSIERESLFANQETALTYAQLVEKIDGVFNAFMSSYYIGDISAAIGRAMDKGAGSAYHLAYLDENYTVTPIFDEMALYRLKSADILPVQMGTITQNVVDRTLASSGVVEFDNSFASSIYDLVQASLKASHVLHTAGEKDATPSDVMVIGSLTVNVGDIEDDEGKLTAPIRAHGMEIATGARVYRLAYNAAGVATLEVANFPSAGVLYEESGTAVTQRLAAAAVIARDFDFLPNVRIAFGDDTGFSQRGIAYLTDYDYSTVVSDVDVAKLHSTAVYAMLGIPENA